MKRTWLEERQGEVENTGGVSQQQGIQISKEEEDITFQEKFRNEV